MLLLLYCLSRCVPPTSPKHECLIHRIRSMERMWLQKGLVFFVYTEWAVWLAADQSGIRSSSCFSQMKTNAIGNWKKDGRISSHHHKVIWTPSSGFIRVQDIVDMSIKSLTWSNATLVWLIVHAACPLKQGWSLRDDFCRLFVSNIYSNHNRGLITAGAETECTTQTDN